MFGDDIVEQVVYDVKDTIIRKQFTTEFGNNLRGWKLSMMSKYSLTIFHNRAVVNECLIIKKQVLFVIQKISLFL